VKTKFLSAVLALTMLCSVFSASAISVAAANLGPDLGEGKIPDVLNAKGGTDVSFVTKDAGFAGKNESAVVQTATVGATATEGNKGTFPGFKITHGLDFEVNGVSTFQFDLYTDGDIWAAYSFQESDVLVWKPNGDLLYIYGNSIGDKNNYNNKRVGNYARNRWHTIALTYDYSTCKQKVYVDGVLIDETYRQGGYDNSEISNHVEMRIGAYAGSKNGRLAIDNVFAYAGAYDPLEDKLTSSESENLIVASDGNTIIYNEEFFKDAQSLKNEIISATGASKAEFFNDKFTEASKDKITANVVLTSASGLFTHYYNLQPMFTIGTPELVSDAGMVGAKAVVYNYHAQPKTLTMIMAIRDAQGSLEKVYSTQSYDVSGEKVFTIDPVYAGDGSAYVFFIENWDTLRAVAGFEEKIN